MDSVAGNNMERVSADASAAPVQVHERTDDRAPNRGGHGGSGRGRGGCGRGGRGQSGRGRGRDEITDQDQLIGKLPAALQPPIGNGGWELLTERNSAAFDIITEEEYADKYSSKKLRETFIHMADSVNTHCTRYGKDNDNPSVFITLFSRNAAEMIQTHTTELLVKDGYKPLTVSELYQFVAMMLILSRIRTPTKKTYQEFLPFIEAKHKVKMMSYSRFTQI